VTAGKFQHSSDRHETPVGRFVYGRTYLERANAVAIDSVELNLDTGTVRLPQATRFVMHAPTS